MTRKEALKLFEDKKVRTVWDGELEKWFSRKEIEANIGKSIVSPLNAKNIRQIPENSE